MSLVLSKYKYCFPVNNREKYAMFSYRTNKLIFLSAGIYKELHKKNFSHIPSDTLSLLKEYEFLVDTENEYMDIVSANRKQASENNDSYLYYVIQPTADCQFSCNYCGQKHVNKSLSEKNIDLLINRIKDQLIQSGKKSLVIAWFGGEPLLAMDKMRIINRRIKEEIEQGMGCKYSSKIVTNGVLFTKSIYEELVNDFNLLHSGEITLDGTKEFHDKRRVGERQPESFDVIYANILDIVHSETYKEKNVKMTIRCNVDRYNSESVPALIRKLQSDGLADKIILYFCPVYSWAQNGADKNSLALNEFSDKMLEWGIQLIKAGFGFNFLPSRQYSTCASLAGNIEMTDAFGNIFDCTEVSYSPVYESSSHLLGSLKDYKKIRKSDNLKDYYESLISDDCKKCTCFPFCGGGCPVRNSEGGKDCSIFKYNMKNFIKITMLHNVYNVNITEELNQGIC